MRRNMRLCLEATFCLLIPLASPAMSQERSPPVDTGVILSAQEAQRSGLTPPHWTPSPEEIARLEVRLKEYLEGAMTPEAKAIAARPRSYKRQYLGYTGGGKKLIYVSSFCESYWKREDSWRNGLIIFFDGGPCYFQVRYDPSSGQFHQLQVNGPLPF